MRSIEPSDRELLRVDRLSVSFRSHHAQVSSLRDVFVRSLSMPRRPVEPDRDKVHALRDVELVVCHGDRVGVLGKNGSGKSTLCRALAGRHGRLPEVKSQVQDVRAVLGDTMGIYPELSGAENARLFVELMFPLLNRHERRNLLSEAIEFSGLGDDVRRPLKHYSTGMRARLFMAVVSAHPAELLILDEALSGADAFFNARMMGRYRALMESSQASIVVSHSLDEVRAMCTRVIVLEHGRKVFDGGVEEGVTYYQTAS